jgi:protein gp37
MLARVHTIPWPLPNVGLGVWARSQDEADGLVPDLLNTPAALRFLICDPMLVPIDLQHKRGWLAKFEDEHHLLRGEGYSRLDWVIAGAADVEGLRALRDQCKTWAKPFFLQWAVSCGCDPCDEFCPVTVGEGSRFQKGVIELPRLDGVQHLEFPAVRS